MLDGSRLGSEILPKLSVQRDKELWRKKDKRNQSKHLRQEGAHRLMNKINIERRTACKK
jgi:hypothetical protein